MILQDGKFHKQTLFGPNAMRVRLIVLMVLSTSRTKEPVEETKDKVVEAFARPTRWLFEMSRIRDDTTRITVHIYDCASIQRNAPK